MVQQEEQPTSTKIPTKKILLWIAMGSMVMLFAAMTSAYLVRQAEGNWLQFDLPVAFTYSTAVLLLSSFTIYKALSFSKKGEIAKAKIFILITFVLGLTFLCLQYLGWKMLIAENIVFAGKASNPSGSFLYVITGLHGAHLIFGLLALLYCIYITIKKSKSFNSKNVLSIELTSIFWHFLDGLWIYLFLFLLLGR